MCIYPRFYRKNNTKAIVKVAHPNFEIVLLEEDDEM